MQPKTERIARITEGVKQNRPIKETGEIPGRHTHARAQFTPQRGGECVESDCERRLNDLVTLQHNVERDHAIVPPRMCEGFEQLPPECHAGSTCGDEYSAVRFTKAQPVFKSPVKPPINRQSMRGVARNQGSGDATHFRIREGRQQSLDAVGREFRIGIGENDNLVQDFSHGRVLSGRLAPARKLLCGNPARRGLQCLRYRGVRRTIACDINPQQFRRVSLRCQISHPWSNFFPGVPCRN